jgi:hypothetical protein
MGPGIFLIAIMGCGDSDSACKQVRLLDTHFSSRAECVAATENALMRNSDVEYPTVVAQCVNPREPASYKVMSDEVRLPEPPLASAPNRIASRR